MATAARGAPGAAGRLNAVRERCWGRLRSRMASPTSSIISTMHITLSRIRWRVHRLASITACKCVKFGWLSIGICFRQAVLTCRPRGGSAAARGAPGAAGRRKHAARRGRCTARWKKRPGRGLGSLLPVQPAAGFVRSAGSRRGVCYRSSRNGVSRYGRGLPCAGLWIHACWGHDCWG